MLEFIIIVGAILLVAIIIAVLRISSLSSVAQDTDKKVDIKSNKWNGALMLLFLLVSGVVTLYFSTSWFDEYTLPLASEHGALTDKLFWITMGITGAVFILTQVLLFYFSFRYQYREGSRAHYYPENDKLEIVWTVVPAIALTVLVISGLRAWNDITSEAPDNAEVVEIMGQQFAWSTRYPGKDGELGAYDYRLIDPVNSFGIDFTDRNAFDDFVPREMHIPKGKPVLFKIRARDVLHSVFAPHFRLKMDAVPGMPTKFWFVPTKTTEEMRAETGNPDFNYEIACTEICGRGHFSMRMLVVVDEPQDFENWKAEQESWLSKNPEYMAKIPENMKELAMINAGISNQNLKK